VFRSVQKSLRRPDLLVVRLRSVDRAIARSTIKEIRTRLRKVARALDLALEPVGRSSGIPPPAIIAPPRELELRDLEGDRNTAELELALIVSRRFVRRPLADARPNISASTSSGSCRSTRPNGERTERLAR
jgi:hypothetical protein